MEQLVWILIGITALFFLLLALKNILNLKKTCAICLSVTLAWITLLIFYFLEIFNDKIIIAVLMGHTSLGIYYMLEKKVRKSFLFFRLPYLLTSIWLIYFIIEGFILNSLYVIFILWLLFILVYLLRNNSGFSKFVNKLIECCKRW